MEMTMERPTKTLIKRLIMVAYDTKRQGYDILSVAEAEEKRFDFNTLSAKEAATILFRAAKSNITPEDFHIYRPFTEDGVEYHTVQFDLWLSPERCQSLLKSAGFSFTPLLQHRLCQRVKMAMSHLIL